MTALEGPNGQIYVGRTSGFGTPEQLVMKRYRGHHMKAKGFKILKSIEPSKGYMEEQQSVEENNN